MKLSENISIDIVLKSNGDFEVVKKMPGFEAMMF